MTSKPDHDSFDVSVATPAAAAGGTINTLENLAGFVEDINNLSMRELGDPDQLDRVVKQRFGKNVTRKDVIEAMGALRDLSNPV